ncbi:MAG: mandelate racemase [Candidatus Bathyarchaeota archaeon B63]|nr:MAG: mandelate racemase [Candidatus Bathyarchaeota archaeon B63]
MRLEYLRITDLKAITLGGSTVIRVETDEDIYGYGEAHCPKQHVMSLKRLIIGEDPTDVARVMKKIRFRGAFKPFGSPVSSIEMALWDIAGKAAGLPVHKLLGGKIRERVRVYCDCGVGVRLDPEDPSSAYSPEAYAEKARMRMNSPEGFTILKFDIGFHGGQLLSVPGGSYEAEATYPTRGHVTERGLKAEVACVEAIKEVLGDKVGLAVDCGPGQILPAAIRLARALEPFNLVWAEDLLTGDYTPYTDPKDYRLLTSSTSTPILTGEQIYLRHGFRDLIEQHAVDIVAPDICDVGGLAEAKWIAELADLYGLLIAPHNTGLPIAFMANVHVGAAMPQNFIAFEFHSADIPRWEDLIEGVEKPMIKEGFVKVPDSPGLGIELNEKVARRCLPEGEGYFE